jgi:hypothetical protein
MNIVDLCLDVEGFLGRHREDSLSPEEQTKFLVAIDAIRFIAASGQQGDFEDYRKSLDDNEPPLVIAAFTTRAEAESWLREHPNPPLSARVLVSGEYYWVISTRDVPFRKLRPSPDTLAHYLAEMVRDGLPAPVATFTTREEAEAWLHAQPEPPRQVFIQIAGESYLAAYHHRIHLRALYPVSLAAKSGGAPSSSKPSP